MVYQYGFCTYYSIAYKITLDPFLSIILFLTSQKALLPPLAWQKTLLPLWALFWALLPPPLNGGPLAMLRMLHHLAIQHAMSHACSYKGTAPYGPRQPKGIHQQANFSPGSSGQTAEVRRKDFSIY